MLTWLHEPDIFVDVPELDKLLENRSQAELISLIQQMVARHSDLEQLLELTALNNLAPGEPLPPDLIAQQVRRSFSSAGGEMGGDNAVIADNLQPILDLGEDLLDRKDVSNASTVYQTLLESMLTYEDCLYKDLGGDLGQVLAECEQGIEECLKSTQDPELRNHLLRALFDLFVWDLQAGSLGYSDETPSVLTNQSTPEEKQQIAGWIQIELPYGDEWEEDYQRRALGGLWLGLMADQLDNETYLRICRETGRTQDLINRLLDLHRVDEALSEARTAANNHLTAIADLFEEHGHPKLAEKLIKEHPNSETEVQLLEWLKQYAQRHDQPEEGLRLAESLFWQSQSVENYTALLEAAQMLDKRDEIRARALEGLESAGNFSLLVEIYMHENDMDQALAALERVNPDMWWGRLSALRRQVAQTVEMPRPHDAIRQYLLLVEELIDQRGRGEYAEAARLLQQVRKLLFGLGEENRWEQIISGMRQEYQRMPALADEMRRANIF